MKDSLCHKRAFWARKVIATLILVAFFFNLITPAGAQLLPAPGTMVGLTPGFQPPVLLGLKIHPENPLLFDFIVDQGETKLSQDELKSETEKLVKYFLAALTIPDKEVWVNLSPYEKNRIIPDVLGQTTMGKTMLEQDYMLKQLASSLTNPDEKMGQEFWAKVKDQTKAQLGTTDVPMNTFNKVWIVPQKAEVLESNGIVLVGEKKLKVMMADDYEHMTSVANDNTSILNIASIPSSASIASEAKQSVSTKQIAASPTAPRPTGTPFGRNEKEASISSDVFRATILPNIEKEINEGKNFANVRQIYNSVILAAWYKKALKESLLGKVYTDKGKVAGVENDDKDMKQKIYEQYLEAFKKGVYNLIKEDTDATTGDAVPRKYFSGGAIMGLNVAGSAVLEERAISMGQIQEHVEAAGSTVVAEVYAATAVNERAAVAASAVNIIPEFRGIGLAKKYLAETRVGSRINVADLFKIYELDSLEQAAALLKGRKDWSPIYDGSDTFEKVETAASAAVVDLDKVKAIGFHSAHEPVFRNSMAQLVLANFQRILHEQERARLDPLGHEMETALERAVARFLEGKKQVNMDDLRRKFNAVSSENEIGEDDAADYYAVGARLRIIENVLSDNQFVQVGEKTYVRIRPQDSENKRILLFGDLSDNRISDDLYTSLEEAQYLALPFRSMGAIDQPDKIDLSSDEAIEDLVKNVEEWSRGDSGLYLSLLEYIRKNPQLKLIFTSPGHDVEATWTSQVPGAEIIEKLLQQAKQQKRAFTPAERQAVNNQQLVNARAINPKKPHFAADKIKRVLQQDPDAKIVVIQMPSLMDGVLGELNSEAFSSASSGVAVVVEDRMLTRREFVWTLVREGYTVFQASNVADALKIVSSIIDNGGTINMITTDGQMPLEPGAGPTGDAGLILAEKLADKFGQVPVLLYTGDFTLQQEAERRKANLPNLLGVFKKGTADLDSATLKSEAGKFKSEQPQGEALSKISFVHLRKNEAAVLFSKASATFKAIIKIWNDHDTKENEALKIWAKFFADLRSDYSAERVRRMQQIEDDETDYDGARQVLFQSAPELNIEDVDVAAVFSSVFIRNERGAVELVDPVLESDGGQGKEINESRLLKVASSGVTRRDVLGLAAGALAGGALSGNAKAQDEKVVLVTEAPFESKAVGRNFYALKDGPFNLTGSKTLRLTFPPDQEGVKFLVRLLPQFTSVEQDRYLNTTVYTVPKGGGIIDIPISDFPISTLENIRQISLHSGSRAWENNLSQDKTKQAVPLKIETVSRASAPTMVDTNKFTKGGIDFDPTNMNLQIKRDGKGVPLPLPQQNLDQINIQGLFPVIINIVPVNAQTLPVFLGEAPKEPGREPQLAGSAAS